MENFFESQLQYYSQKPDFTIKTRHSNRSMLFEYIDDKNERRVRKYLSENHYNRMELKAAKTWYNFLGYDAEAFRHHSTVVVDMPWLGHNLRDVAYLFQHGYGANVDFQGFTTDEASLMLDNTYQIHYNFASAYNLLHLDLWLEGDDRPFNVLYHPDLNFFPFIDAESFTPATPESWLQFDQDFVHFTNFVMTQLLRRED